MAGLRRQHAKADGGRMGRGAAILGALLWALLCFLKLGPAAVQGQERGENTPNGTLQPLAKMHKPVVELPFPRQVEGPRADLEGLGPIQDSSEVFPISLAVAFRLTQTNNLNIPQAQQVVEQAQAALQRAMASLAPNVNIGSTYTYHQGNTKKAEGNIIKANQTSLFAGGGPSISLTVADVIFAPLVARQLRNASQASRQRVTNETYQLVADAYFNVMRARRRLARVGETLEFLTSEQPAAARAQSRGLLPLVQKFVDVGGAEALRAELERVRVEVLRREEERSGARQDLRVAAAELARLIRLDPEIPLWPVEDFRYPLPLPGDQWSGQPIRELIGVALQNRPELAENRALVQAALNRIRAARSRPLLPNMIVNYNWGDFGGSPELYTLPGTTSTYFGSSGSIRHFNTRSDFDFSLIWHLQNMGLGDLAAIREQQALHRQTQLRQMQTQDRVVAEIVQAHEQVQGWRQRVAVTARALFDDEGAPRGPVFQALRLNFERIRNVPGTRPLEVLDSIRGLNDLLDAYGQAVTEYERARIRLIIALGLPAQQVLNPPEQSLPPPEPIANPAPNRVSS